MTKAMTISPEKQKAFNSSLATIKASGEKLAAAVHAAGLIALQQANEHGNDGFGVRLMEALGKKHDAKRVEKWLCHFGKFGMKAGKLVYRARRDIAPENLDAWAKKADECPYWELTVQEHHKFVFDGIGMLSAIVNRHAKAKEHEAAGDAVEIRNEGILAEVQGIINKYALAASQQKPVAQA